MSLFLSCRGVQWSVARPHVEGCVGLLPPPAEGCIPNGGGRANTVKMTRPWNSEAPPLDVLRLPEILCNDQCSETQQGLNMPSEGSIKLNKASLCLNLIHNN